MQTTDTFTDAKGRRYIGGQEVCPECGGNARWDDKVADYRPWNSPVCSDPWHGVARA